MSAALLIIGYGNSLRGDDGVGLAVVHRLQKDPDLSPCCDFDTSHQLLPEHAEVVTHYTKVVFVDASCQDRPGSVVLEELSVRCDSEFNEGTSAHSLGPEQILKDARRLYGKAPSAHFCRIGGSEFGFSDNLSPAVQPAVGVAVSRIKALLIPLCRGKSSVDHVSEPRSVFLKKNHR